MPPLSPRARLAYDRLLGSGMAAWVGHGDPVAIGRACFTAVASALPLRPDMRVLDFGCGIGRTAVLMADYLTAGELVGIDIVSGMIEFCRRELVPLFPNASFVLSATENPLYDPFKADAGLVAQVIGEWAKRHRESFDLVYAFSVFTHFDPGMAEATLSLFAGLLKPGGLAFFSAFLDGADNPEDRKLRPGECWRDCWPEPLSWVVHAPDALLAMAYRAGLAPRAVYYGDWRGGAPAAPMGAQFQDALLLGRRATLPADFDPELYISLHADLAAAKVDGAEHYRRHGFFERRPHRPSLPPGPGGHGFNEGRYWLAHPLVTARVHRLISGDPDCDAYGRLERLLRERGWHLPIERAVSLGCGFGTLERDLVRRGLVRSIDGYNLAEGAVEQARRLAREAGLASSRYHLADLETLAFPPSSLDAVFTHQAVHHVDNLEALFASVRSALRAGGVFHLHEFVGPSRFQWTDAQLEAVNGYLFSLPPRLRRLPDARAKPPLHRLSVAAMIAANPSEAVRSADILTALDRFFEVIERRDLGGTLVHLALGDIAQNFDSAEPEDRGHLERLFELEDRLLAEGAIGSDFVVVTAVPRSEARARRP